MKLYLKIYLAFVFATIAINIPIIISKEIEILKFFLWLLTSVSFCGLWCGICCVVRLLPKTVLNPSNKRFRSRKNENEIYNKLKVKKWKDKIPELGKLSSFPKDKIAKPADPEYLKKFLMENCFAELMHHLSIYAGVILIAFLPIEFKLSIGVPIALMNLVLHGMPVLVQRYLRPKLLALYNRAKRKQNVLSYRVNELKEAHNGN